MLKFIFLLLVCSSSYADNWTSSDTKREIAYQTLAAVDWLQTRNIARNPAYHEQNAVLGLHPSIGQVNNYFLITGLAHYLIADYLTEWRRPFQWVTVGIEFGAIAHNFSIGISARF